MKRARPDTKPHSFDAEYQDFFSSIREIVKYLAALKAKAARKYEPIVNGIIDSRTEDPGEIERALDGLLDHCDNPAVLRFFKRLCRYYYQLDPAATSTYIGYYLEQWEPERYRQIIKARKKKK